MTEDNAETELASGEFGRLLTENYRFADQFDRSTLQAQPLARLAVLTCMDARIAVEEIFGLRPGDANVIRNAGAVASDDAIRSLALSTQVLGADEIVVMAHTGCGLHNLDEIALADRLVAQTGSHERVDFGSFEDPAAHVRRQVARLREHPWIAARTVHGVVYDVQTGRVTEVS